MKIVTANRLSDGAPVYRTATGAWTEVIAEAETHEGGETAEAALAAAKGQETIVVGAYLVNVEAPGAPVAREQLRETIRARGPSIHPQFARAGNAHREPKGAA